MIVSEQTDLLIDELSSIGATHGRQYFWHGQSDPYVTFLAEFFLRRSNRTTVSRFLPAFLERYPHMQALAAASPEVVVSTARWAGMRKRTMHLPKVARQLLDGPPPTAATLRTLPHIGPYAADAIALYAFREPTFPIDGNVGRVLGRFLGLSAARLPPAAERVRDRALRRGGVSGLQNTHLGALVLGWESCRVKPACGSCPLRLRCEHAQRTPH